VCTFDFHGIYFSTVASASGRWIGPCRSRRRLNRVSTGRIPTDRHPNRPFPAARHRVWASQRHGRISTIAAQSGSGPCFRPAAMPDLRRVWRRTLPPPRMAEQRLVRPLHLPASLVASFGGPALGCRHVGAAGRQGYSTARRGRRMQLEITVQALGAQPATLASWARKRSEQLIDRSTVERRLWLHHSEF
jgi:hypothetical protein